MKTLIVRQMLVALQYSLLTQVVTKAIGKVGREFVQVKILLYINTSLLNKQYQYLGWDKVQGVNITA